MVDSGAQPAADWAQKMQELAQQDKALPTGTRIAFTDLGEGTYKRFWPGKRMVVICT